MTEENAEYVIYNICLYDNYLLKYGNTLIEWENWLTEIDETGMTDKFREYFKNNDGILPIKNFSKIEVISVDVKNKSALVKIYLEDENKYYDITWTTDNELRLDTVDVRLNHQEKE